MPGPPARHQYLLLEALDFVIVYLKNSYVAADVAVADVVAVVAVCKQTNLFSRLIF
jgi:hypothetical protein